MKPRIAKVTGTYGIEVQNGVGRFLAGLHEWSQAQDFPLQVFSSGDHTDNYAGVQNIRALSFTLPGGFNAVQAYYPLEGRRKQLRRALKEYKPDIVHLSTPEAIGTTGLWIARKYNYPVAGIYHTDFPSFARHIVRDAVERVLRQQSRERAIGPLWQRLKPAYETHTRWWERWLLRYVARRVLRRNSDKIGTNIEHASDWLADAAQSVVRETLTRFYGQFKLVIARSGIYREKLIQELSLPVDRVRTLRSGVDTGTFSPQPTAVDEGLRHRFGIPNNSKVILYVGRVTDEKNVGFLADAWRIYREKNRVPDAVFVVVGSGNLDEFRQRAGAGVHTFGPRHGRDLSAVYRLADIFWTASTNETLGQVVLESQASGVPTIVTDQGAAKESVQDGRTGRVLPADSPARWSKELQLLLGEDDRLAKMGRAARVYSEAHTIESSYQHYWELHEELLERERVSTPAHFKGISFRRATEREESTCEQGPHSTHISDFHAGKRSKKISKEAALRIACRRASERGAKVFLHGDFLDTRPPLHKCKEEIVSVRRTLDEFGIVPEVYIEGNHDYEFGRASEIEMLIGCPVAPSLIHRDTETGLVLTHGHVSELPGIQSLLQSVRSRDELVEALSVDRLENTLKQFALKYDAVGVVTDLLESCGLQGLEDAWRHSFAVRRWLADRLMDVARNRSLDDHSAKAIIHMIGSSDREQVLSQLCSAMGGWGLVYGHTHEPHVTKQRVTDPLTGRPRTVLLGNCGSFRRKTVPPTWIESAFPRMELWAFNAKKEDAELLDSISLSSEEARFYDVTSPAELPREPQSAVG